MKKALLLILLTLLLPTLLGLEISLTKEVYYPKETLQAEIPNAFINPLIKDNLKIYSNDSVHEIPGNSGLVKTGEKYLYYFTLPETPGTYELRIENSAYQTSTETIEDTIIQTFEIKATNNSYLGFNPGFIYTSENFYLTLTAYNQAQEISVNFPELGIKQNFSLGYGEEKTLFFSIAKAKYTIDSEIRINNYKIPAKIILNSAPINSTNTNYSNQSLKENLELQPEEIRLVLLAGKNYFVSFTLNSEKILKNLTLLTEDKELRVNPSYISELKGEKRINLTINSDKNLESVIKIKKGEEIVYLPISITLTTNETKVNTTLTTTPKKTCEQLGGKKCLGQEECTGQYTTAADGACCLSVCEKPSKPYTWIWGVLILIIIIAVLYFFFQKYKKGESGEKSFQSILKKRNKDYEEKFHPAANPEVRKSLTKN